MDTSVDLLDRKLATGNADHLFASFPGADVFIKAEERDDVRVSVQGEDFADANQAYQRWEEAAFKARNAEGTLRMEVKAPPLRHRTPAGRLRVSILVPVDLNIHIRAIANRIQITNVSARTEVEISGGSLSVTGFSGRLSVYSQSASIELNQLTDSVLRLEIAGGALHGQNLSLDRCSLQASSATIRWEHVNGPSHVTLSACRTFVRDCRPGLEGHTHGGELHSPPGEADKLRRTATRMIEKHPQAA